MKKRPFLIVDFDGTIADTSLQEPFRRTAAGLNYLSEHPDIVVTPTYSCISAKKSIQYICNGFQDSNRIVIISDAPERVIEPLLPICGLRPDIPIIGSAGKPFADRFPVFQALFPEVRKEELIVIGDSPKDILFAHNIQAASIGVTWQYSNNTEYEDKMRRKLLNANASYVINKTEELLDLIRAFSDEQFEYVPRRLPRGYQLLNGLEFDETKDLEINNLALIPHDKNHPDYGKVLDFKSAKAYFKKEIEDGITCDYFSPYYGKIRQGKCIADIISDFSNSVNEVLNNLHLIGETKILTAPNSCPHWCYKSDINQYFAKQLNAERIKRIDGMVRLFPVKEAHLYQRISTQEHKSTMGISSRLSSTLATTKNLIIFDDVRTSGSQTNTMASAARAIGFGGNIFIITLSQVNRLNNGINISELLNS